MKMNKLTKIIQKTLINDRYKKNNLSADKKQNSTIK